MGSIAVYYGILNCLSGIAMLFFLSSFFACQVMDSPGQVFTPVTIVEEPVQPAVSNQDVDGNTENTDKENEAAIDPLFADPQEEIILGGEVPENEVVEEVVSVEDEAPRPEISPDPAVVNLPTPPVAPTSFRKATVKDGWRPTLIGTLMEGPTPRAILAMPNGDEKVIRAGDMLSDDGVVVMAIGTNYVELAVIRSAEGRAQIENLTLSSQFQ